MLQAEKEAVSRSTGRKNRACLGSRELLGVGILARNSHDPGDFRTCCSCAPSSYFLPELKKGWDARVLTHLNTQEIPTSFKIEEPKSPKHGTNILIHFCDFYKDKNKDNLPVHKHTENFNWSCYAPRNIFHFSSYKTRTDRTTWAQEIFADWQYLFKMWPYVLS